ncbi:Uncharacterised protein g911 [Pycnogonum litorale]
MAFRIGIIVALIASFLFSVNVSIIYIGLEEVSAESFIAVRYIFQAIISLPELLKNPMQLKMSAKNFFLTITSCVFLGTMTMTAYYSLAYIPPLDSACIYNFQSVFMIFIGCIFLKERLLAYEIFMVITITSGVILVCQPEFIFGELSSLNNSERSIGIGLAMCTSLASSIGNAIFSHLKEIPLSVFNYILGITCTSMMFVVFTGNLKTPTTTSGVVCLISSGIAACAGRHLLQYALKIEQATLVVAVLPLELVFSAIIQSVFLEIVPNSLAIVGSILIATSIILLSLKNYFLNFANRCKGKQKECDNSEIKSLIPWRIK